MCRIENGDSNVFNEFYNKKYEGNVGEAVEQEEKLCDEVEAVSEFIYLGDQGECWWRMFGYCDCQKLMWVG